MFLLLSSPLALTKRRCPERRRPAWSGDRQVPFTTGQASFGETAILDTARANRYRAVTSFIVACNQGESQVSKLSIFALATALSVAATTPSLAAAQTAPAKPGARPAAGQQQQPSTRANVAKGLDNNFKSIDTNGDGTLSAAELAAAEGKVQQRRIAQRRTQHEGGFTRLDTNKDGSLSKAEFMAAAPNASSATPNGAAIVTRLDSNKDGRVTTEEYRAPVLAQFDRADTNKDGVLSDAERKAAARK